MVKRKDPCKLGFTNHGGEGEEEDVDEGGGGGVRRGFFLAT